MPLSFSDYPSSRSYF
uniref:Uncharacterized protein n=1 Tax=Arundo donax TaxID=35708 RepID=A0A0A9CBK2_ARUDO